MAHNINKYEKQKQKIGKHVCGLLSGSDNKLKIMFSPSKNTCQIRF